MRDLIPRASILAAALLAASCGAPPNAEIVATGPNGEDLTHCQQQRLLAADDNYPADIFDLFSGAPEPDPRLRGVAYERACSVFVSGQDRRLRQLVGAYLDLQQQEFGGSLVRTLDFEDGVVPIKEGAAHVFKRRLVAGKEYRLIGACDNECGDLDVLVLGANGEALSQDMATDNYPVVSFTPEADGDYRIALAMYRCAADPCYAGLRVLEQNASWSREPNYGTLELTAGLFEDPHMIAVTSGGDIDMSRRQSNCAGFVTDQPDLRLIFHKPTAPEPADGEASPAPEAGLPLIFSVHSEGDTTLVINGPDSLWYCDDDGGVLGANPMVIFNGAPEGQYDIWIGTYGEEGYHDARLAISQRTSQ